MRRQARRAIVGVSAAVFTLSYTQPALAAGGAAAAGGESVAGGAPSPAGGAPIDQVIEASLAAGIVLAALIAIGMRRRAGRPVPGLLALEGLATFSMGGVPGWAALPVALCAGSLLTAVFGLNWDVSYHIDNGRDPGPLANPAHYFILLGLLGIFAAGWLAVVLPHGRPGPASIRIRRDWYAPVGGLMMMSCASFAAIGFPLDDVWHRLFGQDVTLWGPTHLMMLSGAAMTLIAIMVLLAEGRLAARSEPASSPPPTLPLPIGALAPVLQYIGAPRVRMTIACGGLLAGLSIYQGEFDFGVPQFRLLFHPMLIALAASVALGAARRLGGRGAALQAALFFIGLRGVILLIVSGPLGRSVEHFPLYLAEALLVELIAARLHPERPYRFALACGAAIGTLGVLAEWAWSQAWMPLPWPAHLIPAAIAVSLPAALAGGVLSAFLVSALQLRGPSILGRGPLLAGFGSIAVVAALVVALLPVAAPEGASARVTLTDVQHGPGHWVNARVAITPATIADRADWLTGTAWQGHRNLVVTPLRHISGGVWETTSPLPADGSWKTAIRLHRGSTMASVPIYLPADAAIPVAGVPPAARSERSFVNDRVVLQRERKRDVPGWLWHSAAIAVMSTIAALLILLGWALRRLAASQGETTSPAPAQGPREATGVGRNPVGGLAMVDARRG